MFALRDIDDEITYMREASGSFDLKKDKPDISENLDEFIKLCEEEKVNFGYLFKDNKWKIVSGLCIGELIKR